jgi:N4-gp56 family major capsid protein
MAQLWGTDSVGGYMYSDQLSEVLRTALQPVTKFRQFCDAKDASSKGLHAGELFHWNVYSDVAVQGTTLTETNTVPETSFTIAQGTLTMTEWGNSVPYTGKLDDLSLHPVKEIIHKALKNDAKKSFDTAAEAEFSKCALRVVAETASTITKTTDGTATATNSSAMKKAHVGLIVDYMKERNIEPYMGDDYFAIARPSTYRTLRSDLESIHQYIETGFTMIMFGEIGRYEGVRFVEQTNIASASWTGLVSDEAYFFGADTVAEAIAIPEEIRGKIPTDFGRSRGIAWYYLGGFGIVYPSSGGSLMVAQSRIVKWDSNA